MPETPSRTERQKASLPMPQHATAPSPVTTTLWSSGLLLNATTPLNGEVRNNP